MDKRLIYRVIIKSLFLIAIFVLALVFINSLFTMPDDKNNNQKKNSIVDLSIGGMNIGEIRKTHWEGKEVSVMRLANNSFFTFVNVGDSGNCPLFKEPNSFKDVCTGTRFDFSGRQLANEEHGFKLIIPPHFYLKDAVIIGKWENKPE